MTCATVDEAFGRVMFMARGLLVAALCAGVAFAGEPGHDRSPSTVERRACSALAARVDSFPGGAPVLLRSFDDAGGAGAPKEPALATAAFTYDNALAVVALVACDRPAQAARIGSALLSAAQEERPRNAYVAGAQTGTPVPNGWWSTKDNRWAQDPYQTGIATGNAAWAALALLTLADRTENKRWARGAERLASMAVAKFADDSGPGGFSGGLSGFDGKTERLTWKSTEHNVDLLAVFSWLARTTGSASWTSQAAKARRFVDAQFDAASGRFLIGTKPDGRTQNRDSSGLDVQLWPMLLADADPRWRAALGFAEREHGVTGGFDYNGDRDGLWVEGTAQAALAYRSLGRAKEYEACMEEVSRHFSSGGLVFATREPRITTGLSINPASASDDLHYFHVPHLGATAWAAIAASGWNPFVGKNLPASEQGGQRGKR
jgi:hypothetical protein